MQPVRSADYPAHLSLRQVLVLPENTVIPDATADEALAAWRDYVGFGGPLLLVRSPDRARKLLMAALGVANGEPVAIPVNTRRYLSEAVKRSGGKPLFVELDADLEFVLETPGLAAARVLWAQPVGGMAPPVALPGKAYLVDHGLTLPAPLRDNGPGLPGAATVFGLHLDDGEGGALIAFNDADLAEKATALLTPEDAPDPGRVLAQVQRLAGPEGLAARQLWLDAEVRLGMEAGAGMPMAECADGVLPHGLAVCIPEEAELATFISYVRNELVALDWLPEVQPMFYVAFQVTQDPALTRRSAEHLARWVMSPIGPDFVDDEITHAVLGILKAAEYTGVRWYTNPGRARWYGEMLVDWYGPDHDAYHPAFAIDVPAQE
jgi:hypothetical protein